jgi:hypothetical protein
VIDRVLGRRPGHHGPHQPVELRDGPAAPFHLGRIPRSTPRDRWARWSRSSGTAKSGKGFPNLAAAPFPIVLNQEAFNACIRQVGSDSSEDLVKRELVAAWDALYACRSAVDTHNRAHVIFEFRPKTEVAVNLKAFRTRCGSASPASRFALSAGRAPGPRIDRTGALGETRSPVPPSWGIRNCFSSILRTKSLPILGADSSRGRSPPCRRIANNLRVIGNPWQLSRTDSVDSSWRLRHFP